MGKVAPKMTLLRVKNFAAKTCRFDLEVETVPFQMD